MHSDASRMKGQGRAQIRAEISLLTKTLLRFTFLDVNEVLHTGGLDLSDRDFNAKIVLPTRRLVQAIQDHIKASSVSVGTFPSPQPSHTGVCAYSFIAHVLLVERMSRTREVRWIVEQKESGQTIFAVTHALTWAVSYQ
eukprot:3115370-Amphidinium_carterae.2